MLGAKHSFLYLHEQAQVSSLAAMLWNITKSPSSFAVLLQQPAGKYLCQSQTLISITAESTFMILGAMCLQRKPEDSTQLFWVSVVPGRKAEENLSPAQELETHHEMAGAVLCYTQLPMSCVGTSGWAAITEYNKISHWCPNVRNHRLLVLLAPTQLTDKPFFTTKPN